MVLTILQLAGIIVPLLGVAAMLKNNVRSSAAIRLMLASIGCAVQGSGMLLMETAQTEAAAAMAVKFQYLGNALFYPFFIAFLLAYLRIRPPRAFFWGWSIFEAAFVVIYWTDPLQEKFIGHFNFVRDNVFHVFRCEAGTSPLLLFRSICLIAILISGLCGTAVRILRTKPKAERRKLIQLAGAQIIVIAALAIQAQWNPRIDVTPMLNSLAMLSVVISMLTDGFFGITDSGRDWVFAQMPNAYLITDSLYGFLNANAKAEELYPILKELKQGAPVPKDLTALFLENDLRYSVAGRTYSKKITEIRQHGKVVGYGALLIDVTEQEASAAVLRDFNAKLQNLVDEKTEHIRNVQNSIITGMATVVESRDNSTGGHIMRTSAVIRIFARHLQEYVKRMELPPRFLHNVRKAAPMHDIGKIAVDDAILRKPGRFTEDEYEQMKKHPAEGERMLQQILAETDDEDFVRIARNVAHFHHERWDGNGYPDRLAGTDIPVEARIMALADVFDALISRRCYKEAFPAEKAFSIMEEGLGTQFDPELGAIFLQCRPELEAYYRCLQD